MMGMNLNVTAMGAQFANGAVASLRNELPSQATFQATLSKFTADQMSPLMGELGQVFKNTFKTTLPSNTVFADALTDQIRVVTDEVSKAVKNAITTSDFTGNAKLINSQLNPAVDAIRENVFENAHHFRADTENLISTGVRQVVFKTAPWVVLSGMVTIGVPLTLLYLYKRATHNMGRPKLAQRTHKVDLFSKIKAKASSAISVVWKGVEKGVLATRITGLICFTPAMAAYLAKQTSLSHLVPRALAVHSSKLINATLCITGMGSPLCNSKYSYPFLVVPALVGAYIAIAEIADNAFSSLAELGKKTAKPIFDPKLKKRLDDIISTTTNIRKNDGFMQNVVLFGPGGTGKTMISEYIAKNSGYNYVMMSGGDLAQYIARGEHITELNKIFESANNTSTPTVLFIDECESLCGDRSKMDRSQLQELSNAFLNHTGKPSRNVMLILTTNRPEDLDPAVINRMDHKLEVNPPATRERKQILNMYVDQFMSKEEKKTLFSNRKINKIVASTAGFTGRTIFKMVNAIASKRATTPDNKLTDSMISQTVKDFVAQERQLQPNMVQRITRYIAARFSN